MRTRGGEAAGSYFMPTQSDRCIAALRRWLSSHAPSGLPVPGPARGRSAGRHFFLLRRVSFLGLLRIGPPRGARPSSAAHLQPRRALRPLHAAHEPLQTLPGPPRLGPPRTTSDHLGPSRVSAARTTRPPSPPSPIGASARTACSPRRCSSAFASGWRGWWASLVWVCYVCTSWSRSSFKWASTSTGKTTRPDSWRQGLARAPPHGPTRNRDYGALHGTAAGLCAGCAPPRSSPSFVIG